MPRALAVTLVLFGLVLGLALVRYAPPAAVPATADVVRFSAERARGIQGAVVGDGASRDVGSPANARARDVLFRELARYGWAVELQHATSCTRYGACAPVTNVVARLEGREPSASGVLLTAHHDSAPASPGASDDAVGAAAVVEAARALAAGPKLRRTVVVVLTDGEEAGLLGAAAFVRAHPLAREVHATVNVDARGSHGPSQMFETSAGNYELVRAIARTSSARSRPPCSTRSTSACRTTRTSR